MSDSKDIKPLFLRPIHVVHVSGDPDARVAISTGLKKCRYPCFSIMSFASLAEASSWALPNLGQQLDCVLLDLALIEADGVDVAIHAAKLLNAPIVVMSAVEYVDMSCRLILAGADHIASQTDLGDRLVFCIVQTLARRARLSEPTLQLQEAAASLLAMQKRVSESPALVSPPPPTIIG